MTKTMLLAALFLSIGCAARQAYTADGKSYTCVPNPDPSHKLGGPTMTVIEPEEKGSAVAGK